MNNNFTESSNTQAVQTITDYRPVIMTHSSQIHSTTSTHGLRCRITHPYSNYPHPQHEVFCLSLTIYISFTLHQAPSHLERKNAYVKIKFIGSAFNSIILQQLINQLNLLVLNNSLCIWILDFVTGRPQSVHVGHNTSSAEHRTALNAKFSSNLIKFADDTTVVGLISNNDETTERKWHNCPNAVVITTYPSM